MASIGKASHWDVPALTLDNCLHTINARQIR
jgi:hypothetical protein